MLCFNGRLHFQERKEAQPKVVQLLQDRRPFAFAQARKPRGSQHLQELPLARTAGTPSGAVLGRETLLSRPEGPHGW